MPTYSRILVALDGSELAERVLPYVEELAGKLGSQVTLFRAPVSPASVVAGTMPPLSPAPQPIMDPSGLIETDEREGVEYLRRVAARLAARGFAVDFEQRSGPPDQAIVAYADEIEAGLIAMTTHGRGGLGRLVLGSVADAVLRRSTCPLLLLRVDE